MSAAEARQELVRMALGADRSNVVQLVLRGGFRRVLLAVAEKECDLPNSASESELRRLQQLSKKGIRASRQNLLENSGLFFGSQL